MKKQGCCMKGQIDLFTWYDREERAEKKLYRKVSKWQSVMPFRLLVFQKAYVALKKSGKIAGTDILEFRQFASFETYESLYLNALHKVFKYCRKRMRNPELLEILTDAYEAEYDWMCQRFQTFKEAE